MFFSKPLEMPSVWEVEHLSQNLTLISGAVYWIDSWTIATGYELTIPEDVIVKLNGGSLWVSGTLSSTGTVGSPVVFTSYKDDSVGGDTNGDGIATSPSKGDWTAIIIVNGTVNLDYASLRYSGGTNASGAITNRYYSGSFWYSKNAFVSINHATISDNGLPGISLVDDTGITGSLSILDSTIQNNTGNGVYAGYGFPTTITNSILSNNSSYAASFYLGIDNTLTLSGNQGSGNLYNAIYLRGTANNLTLAPQGSLVYQFGDITIPTGKTMNLQPGAVIKFNASILWVSGTLNATGTVGSPVVFTSYKDDSVGGDTNGDGIATSPSKGDWTAIIIVNGTVNLDYASLRYSGGTNVSGAITNRYYSGSFWYSKNAFVSINHATISDNGLPGISLVDDTGITGSLSISGFHNSE